MALPTGVTPGGRFADWDPTHAPAYVVCDVDGTLVGPAALASAEVARAVARLQAAGVRVGLATGRMRGAVTELQTQLRPRGPHVLHNGAEVHDGVATLASWPLTAEAVDAVLAIASRHNHGYVEIYTEHGYLVSSGDARARPHWELLGGPPLGAITDAADLAGEQALKATFTLFEPGITDVVASAVEEAGLVAGPAGSPRTPGLSYVNATDPRADKGRAVAHAAAGLGIDLSRVVAVGDGPNDLSMLSAVGTAVAMGQAPVEVRRAAHLVVPEVDAHGLATALDVVHGWCRGAGWLRDVQAPPGT